MRNNVPGQLHIMITGRIGDNLRSLKLPQLLIGIPPVEGMHRIVVCVDFRNP